MKKNYKIGKFTYYETDEQIDYIKINGKGIYFKRHVENDDLYYVLPEEYIEIKPENIVDTPAKNIIKSISFLLSHGNHFWNKENCINFSLNQYIRKEKLERLNKRVH